MAVPISIQRFKRAARYLYRGSIYTLILIGGGTMCASPRFTEPAHNRRPYSCHRYDVYSPKLQRRVTLFGRQALDLWITLEASHQVLSYCERPALVPDVKPDRPFDFWVQRHASEELMLLCRPDDNGASAEVAALDNTMVLGARVRCLDPTELTRHPTLLENWGAIIRDLGAFQRFIPQQLCKDLLADLGPGKPIGQLQQEHPREDSSIVRLAVYMLLHRGQATCAQLATERLGPTHLISPI